MRLATTTLVFCVSALIALGMVMLYSAGMTQNGAHLVTMQLPWFGLGLTACVGMAWLDYRVLQRLALPITIATVILLALVLVPQIGVYKNGARRWFNLGFGLFQPSELGKIALVILLAWYGARYQPRMHEFWKGLVIPGCLAAVLVGLVFVEPDRGCTVLLAAVTAILLVVAGVRWRYIIPPGIAFIFAFAAALWVDPIRRERILAFLHPEQYKDGAGFQSMQGLVAFGAGGWFGRGLGSSRQKLGFIPFHYTDFIFPVIGEELGLIATLLVVLAFVILVICGMSIAMRARDSFGMLLGTGITCLIALQACINIGVVTSVLPNKGMPLPFISYGGSNLLLLLACVGVLLSIAHHSQAARSVAFEALDSENIAPQPA